MTEQPTPETFDVDQYIREATRPESTVDVYTRGNLYGDIVELENRIRIEQQVAAEDESLDAGGVGALEREYEQLLERFAASKLTLRLRGLGAKEDAAIREAHAEGSAQALAYRLIHAALVSPAIPDYEKFEAFLEALGKGQADKIAGAFSRLQTGVMRVSPDFLQRRSSPNATRE